MLEKTAKGSLLKVRNQVQSGKLFVVFECFLVGMQVSELHGKKVVLYLRQLVQKVNLSSHHDAVSSSHVLGIFLELNAFDCNLVPRWQMPGFEDTSVRSFAQF